MAVRVRYNITASVSSTSAEERDLANSTYEVVVDSQNEGGSYKTVLPISTTDQALSLPNVATARLLIIRTNAVDPTLTPSSISIKRNDVGNESIEIAPLSTSREGHLLITTDSLTALYATNPSATVPMNITVTVAGD